MKIFEHKFINLRFVSFVSSTSTFHFWHAGAKFTTMVNYSHRLAAAMKLRLVSTAMLASAICMSYQGVKKVLDGKTRGLGTLNNLSAARYLSVDPEWLAVGVSDEVQIAGAQMMQEGTDDLFSPVRYACNPADLTPLAIELAYTFDELTDRTLRNRAYAAATNEIFKQGQADSGVASIDEPSPVAQKTARHA